MVCVVVAIADRSQCNGDVTQIKLAEILYGLLL